MRLVTTLGLCVVLAACGGSKSSQSGYSCDINASSAHTCIEYSWRGGDYPTSSLASACTAAGGSVVSACDHSTAVGGCEVTAASGAITLKTLTWQYTGAVSIEKSACAAESGTFVAASDGGGGGGPPSMCGGVRDLKFVVSQYVLPTKMTDYTFSYDGGEAVNQFGQLFVTASSVAGAVNANAGIASGKTLLLLDTQEDNAVSSPCATVAASSAQMQASPTLDGSGTFTVAASASSGIEVAIASSDFTSFSTATGGTPATLSIAMALSATTPPVVFNLTAAHISGTIGVGSGPHITNGVINGALTLAELHNTVVPALAAAISASANSTSLQIFDVGCGASKTGANDGVISACELEGNSTFNSLLAPDLDLFSDAPAVGGGDGTYNHYAPTHPVAAGTADSLSFGIGFEAVTAQF